MRLIVIALIAGLSGTSALAISLDATAVNDPALAPLVSDAVRSRP
ncbi:MAG: hypothetical protein AAFN05_09105 [Pseudomonadota bacterium]